MKIELKTLTPLWTGGVDQTCDRLHETGLIGSLRWWYEALVRGLGGQACDPTTHACEFDPRKADRGLCEACQVFGTTGFARKVRIEAFGGSQLFQGRNVLIPSGRIHPTNRGGRAGGWYLFGDSRVGDISIAMHLLREFSEEEAYRLRSALHLAMKHGAIGGKMASGYGVVTYASEENPLMAKDSLPSIRAQSTPRNNALPDLRDFFFARYQFNEPRKSSDWWQGIRGIAEALAGRVTNKDQSVSLPNAQSQLTVTFGKGILPIAPAIRNWLRYHWDSGLKDCEKHYIFGEARSVCPCCYQPGLKEDKKNKKKNWCERCKKSFEKGQELPTSTSKIYVSHAYKISETRWQFRLWGWLPQQGRMKDRDGLLDNLSKALKGPDLWSYIFSNNLEIKPREVSWLALECHQQNGLEWLERLL